MRCPYWPTKPDVVVRTGVYDVITNGRVWGAKAWRVVDDSHVSSWIAPDISRSFISGTDWELHPDADQVWADYCAAVLMDNVENL